MRAYLAGAPACLALVATAPGARAQVPEQLDQLEPGKGESQIEYFGAASRDRRIHAFEAMAGISDRVAVGFELEAQADRGAIAVENIGPRILYRLTPDDVPIAIGVALQAGLGKGGTLREAEARLIAQARRARWWAQADAILRRSSDHGAAGTAVAYGWSLQRAIGQSAWLGLEGSGQSAAPSGDPDAGTEHGGFLGPSLTFELAPAPRRRLELGLAALARTYGDGPRGAVRIFVQLGLEPRRPRDSDRSG